MTNDHFQVRVSKLIMKCRKAVRLYSSIAKLPQSSMSSSHTKSSNDQAQMLEWRDVNQVLLEELQEAFSMYSSKQLVESVYVIRDNYQSRWRNAEAEVHVRTKKLTMAVEGGQFLHAKSLCEQLVSLKAKEDATFAAYSELQSVLDSGSVVRPKNAELSRFDPTNYRKASEVQESIPLTFDDEDKKKAKIIPLRKLV